MAKIKEFTDSSEMSRVSTWKNGKCTIFRFNINLCWWHYFLFFSQEKANQEIDDGDRLFDALMNHVKDAQTKLKLNIEEKLRKSQDKDKVMIEELQDEISQLQRKHSELEELSHSDDHLQLLQVRQGSPDYCIGWKVVRFPSKCNRNLYRIF